MPNGFPAGDPATAATDGAPGGHSNAPRRRAAKDAATAAKEAVRRRAALYRSLPLPLPRGEGRFTVEEDGTLIYPDGSCYAVVGVSLINLFSMGQAEQNRLAYLWSQLVNNLVPGQVLQVIVESNPLPATEVLGAASGLITTRNAALGTIGGWSLDRLRTELTHRHVPALSGALLVGPAPQVKIGLAAGVEGVKRAAGLAATTAEPDRIALDTAVDDVLHQCGGMEIPASRLRRDDVLALLWRTINPGLREPPTLGAAEDLALALAPASWSEGYEQVRTGDTYTRSFYLRNIPEKTSPGSWLTDVISLDCQLRLSWHIEGTDRFKIRKGLLRKRKAAAGMLTAQAQRNPLLLNLDSQSDTYQAEVEAEALSDPSVGVARMTLVVTLQSDDPAALAQAARRAAGVMRIRWTEGVGRGAGIQAPLWRASLPLAQNTARRRARLARTEVIGNGYPYISHSPGMPRGIPVGYTSKGGELVNIDLSSPTLANGVVNVVGVVHSGKTYLSQLFAEWTLFRRGRVTVVDQGAGYKTLCDLVGGVYVAPAKEEAPRTINIWDYTSVEEKRGKVSFLKAAHEIMLTRPGERLTQRELSVLDQAIRHVYAQHPDGSIPLERELVTYLKEQSDRKGLTAVERDLLRNMYETLQQYVGAGEYAYIVDRPTTVDVETELLVFDLEKLPAGMYALMMLTIVDTASRRAENTFHGRRDVAAEMLIVDEGWWVAKYSTAGEWLDKLARRARHIGLLFIFITQQLSDLTDNDTAAALFNASSIKCMFKQSDVRTTSGKDVIEWLASALQISTDEARKLTTLRSGQMMLFRTSLTENTKRGIVDVRASKLEYWIFTSKQSDIPVRRAAVAAAGGDTMQGLVALASGRERSAAV